MSSVISSISQLVAHVTSVVPSWLSLFFTYTESGGETVINGVSALGLFCIVLPLVGLGIGIIRRLVKIRA